MTVRLSAHARAGRIGGLVTSSRHDPRDMTRAARAGLAEKWLREQPEDLPHEERVRRAESAKKAHYLKASAAGVKARKKKLAGSDEESEPVAGAGGNHAGATPPSSSVSVQP